MLATALLAYRSGDDGITFGQLLFYFFFFVVTPLATVVGLVIADYNRLQRMAQLVHEARSNIFVSMKKRQHLANQLIDIVQGYAGHEQLMHLKVSRDAAEVGLAAAYQQTNIALAQIGAVAERFPQIKADGMFRQLMHDLQVIEGELQNKRERYNACCREFNTRRNSFPTVLYAPRFGFNDAPYLDFDDASELDQVKDFVSDDGAAVRQLLAGASQGALKGSRELGGRLTQVGGQLLEKGRKLANDGAAAIADARAARERHSQEDAREPHFRYLDVGNVRRGPVPREELATLLTAGTLRPDSLVCAEGDEHWVKASEALPRPVPPAAPPVTTPAVPSPVPPPTTSEETPAPAPTLLS